MSITRGVVSSWKAIGARPVRVSATEPIALVLTSNEVSKNKMFYFDSLDEALEYFVKLKKVNNKDRTLEQVKEGIKAGTIKGNLFKYLVWAVNKYELIVPTVVVIAKYDNDKSKLKTNVINAIASIKNIPAKYHLRPDIIGVADFTYDVNVAKQYIATLDILRARGFIDLKATSGSDAKTKREQFGSYRVTPVYTDLVDWNVLSDSEDTFSANFVLSIFRCVVDASDTTRGVGWSYSLSNKTLPVARADGEVDFVLGLSDETDFLTQNQITSFIAFNGIRVWNYQTCSADPLLQDATRVRIFDKLTFAVLPAIFPFIDSDRGAKAVKEAKDTIRAFVSDMVGKEVLLGGVIELDTKLTTPTAITNGEFYFKVDTQESPKPTKIAVEFNRVDKFAPVVYKIVS
jgi:phage tail sheath protein FI